MRTSDKLWMVCTDAQQKNYGELDSLTVVWLSPELLDTGGYGVAVTRAVGHKWLWCGCQGAVGHRWLWCGCQDLLDTGGCGVPLTGVALTLLKAWCLVFDLLFIQEIPLYSDLMHAEFMLQLWR